jgi:hypothetical protein
MAALSYTNDQVPVGNSAAALSLRKDDDRFLDRNSGQSLESTARWEGDWRAAVRLLSRNGGPELN